MQMSSSKIYQAIARDAGPRYFLMQDLFDTPMGADNPQVPNLAASRW